MGQYIARRVALLLPAWFIMGIIAFVLIRLIPGDPAAVLLGMEATPQAVADLHARLGLDKPLVIQFGIWLSQVVKGQLGSSFFLGEPVFHAIAARLPVTSSLTTFALIFVLVLGIPMGIHAARRANSSGDVAVMALAALGLSIPDFALGLGLILFFGILLRWLPISGYIPFDRNPADWALHLLMPAFALGIVQAALVARITRSSMLEAIGMDWVRTARAKGVAEPAVILVHVFRNALLPILTVAGNAAVILLGGAFVIETVFNLPGVGNLVVMAVKRRDYPLIQGCILLISTIVIVLNLLVDVLYAYVDPQIRYS